LCILLLLAVASLGFVRLGPPQPLWHAPEIGIGLSQKRIIFKPTLHKASVVGIVLEATSFFHQYIKLKKKI